MLNVTYIQSHESRYILPGLLLQHFFEKVYLTFRYMFPISGLSIFFLRNLAREKKNPRNILIFEKKKDCSSAYRQWQFSI